MTVEIPADPSLLSAEAVCEQQGVEVEKGLSSSEAAARLQRDGLNQLEKSQRPSLLMLFIVQLTSFIILLLITAAMASVGVNASGPRGSDPLSYTTGIAIFVIVILNAGIAAYTENQAGGALEALAEMSQPSIDVIRDGAQQTVATTSVVVGDVVVLSTGDVIPADLRLVEAHDVKVSEMCLTGEPDDVSKNAKTVEPKPGETEKLTPPNMCFSSCSCTNGKGRGVVTTTGMNTRIGKIAGMMSDEKSQSGCCSCLPDTTANQTPLQHNVDLLGKKIGVGAIAVCIAVFIIGLILDTRDPNNVESPAWLYMILIAVTLAVAAIPEGIPLCVTISLSIGSSEMVKKNVLVRKLAAVETLGSASVICTDKTGTLTEGKMTLTNMWSGGVCYDVSGKGCDPTVGKVTRTQTGGDANGDMGVRSSLLAAMLCCNTTLEHVTDEKTGEKKWEPRGNSSEAPLIVGARKIGFGHEEVTKKYKRVLEIPFSSSRKMMLTVSDVSGRTSFCEGGLPLPANSNYLTVCKGAPNYLLELCETWITETGEVEALPQSLRNEIVRQIDDYSSQALRVLAIAVRPMEQLPFDTTDEELAMDAKFESCRNDLQLLGLAASIDPDRDGVKESVLAAHGAHIRVVMITGDYLKTAIAIARNVNILVADDPDDCATDCGKLRPNGEYLSDAEIDLLTMNTKCFARAKPEDKIEIVKSFQRQGFVSAMTGDGVNDAPALHQADIGVAMGIQGTEVAKGAAEMVLTDDNFCSIVTAVEKGRTVYAGIQKFVAFIMSVHIAEVLQIFVCVVANMPVMRTPLQILFLILVTDLPPSIALGMEPGESTILKMRPRPKTEPIMLGWMWLSSCVNGTILTGVIVMVYLISLNYYCEGAILQADIMDLDDFESKLAHARTVAFISLVLSENIRAYIARSFEKPFYRNFLGNKYMQCAVVSAEVALLVAVLLPFFSDKILGLRGVEIGWQGWAISLIGPVGTCALCEAFKVVTYRQMMAYQEKIRREQEEERKAHQALVAEKVKEGSRSTILLGNAANAKEKPLEMQDVKVDVVEPVPPGPVDAGPQDGVAATHSGIASRPTGLCCPGFAIMKH